MNMDDAAEAAPPHFFQIISDQILQLGKLQLPTEFVREYGELTLSGSDVLLVVPTGDTWSIRLEKEKPDHGNNSVVLLGHGLQDFMKHYCLGVGSLVMFRCEGQQCVFSVVIFDITSAEITYPPHQLPVPSFEIETSANNYEVETSSTDDEENTSFDSDTTISEDEDEDEDLIFANSGVCGTSANPIEIDEYNGDEHLASMPNANLQKKKTQLIGRSNRTSAAKAKPRILSFRLKIRPSYLKRKSRVTIPHKFMEVNNLKEDAPWNVWIRPLGSRKTWAMQILYRENERRGEFSNAGWHTFHTEVGLCEGDKCKFKLTARSKDELFFTMSFTSR